MSLPNIHPVDELAALREEIKVLEAREDVLRASLMAGSEEDRCGKQYRAFIQTSTRETLDKASLVAAFGAEVLAPFMRKTDVKSLKVALREESAAAK